MSHQSDPEGDLYLRLPLGVQPYLRAAARHAGITPSDLVLEGLALVLKRLRIPVPADLDEVRPQLPTVYP